MKWSMEAAAPICESVARWAMRQFRGLGQFDYDDLVAEGLKASLEKHGRFKARAGGAPEVYAAWLRKCLKRHLTDLQRSARSDQRRSEAVAETRPEMAQDATLLEAQHGLVLHRPASSLVRGVGRKLKAARRGRSVAVVAAGSGVSPSTIRELEGGRAGDVHLSTLERLALVCGVQVRDLVELERVKYDAPAAGRAKSLPKKGVR